MRVAGRAGKEDSRVQVEKKKRRMCVKSRRFRGYTTTKNCDDDAITNVHTGI